MKESLLQNFRGIDRSIKDNLADINSPLNIALAILYISKNSFNVEYLTSEAIIACLEVIDISFKEKPIIRALARAGNKVNRKMTEDGIKYKIMIPGHRVVEELISGTGLNIVYIQAGSPRTARKHLDAFLKDLKGDIRICDPYYGVRTFDVLELIPKSHKVKFLTEKTSEKESKIKHVIKDFIKERPNIEIKKVTKSNDIHDRFILSNDSLMIIGHGIKDIGNKDSFIFKIDKSLACDLWSQIKDNFDKKWNGA